MNAKMFPFESENHGSMEIFVDCEGDVELDFGVGSIWFTANDVKILRGKLKRALDYIKENK